MAWSASKVFAAAIKDALDRTAALDFDADTFRAALYDNDITPDNTVAASLSAYNTGQWASAGNEVSDSGEWATGGEALVTPDIAQAGSTVKWDAADTVSSGTSATLAAVHGCLVYDDTLAAPVANQGICYNYFGGANAVTNGTFTIVWSASGIFSISAA